jgi:glycosyltransferase involved in cell wall biosynthesis
VPHILHIREFGKEDFNLHFHLGKIPTLFLFKQYTNKVIAISDAIANKYTSYFKDKIIRIYNGVPTLPESKHKFDSETFNIVMVGRISKEKRQIDVVKAIYEIVKSGIKNISLDLYGDGPDLNKINDYVKTNKLEQYIYTKGYCSEINYEKYNTAIMASPYEGFGRVTVEYMMAGLPVIGANSGATPEIVSDNKTGLLFTPGNINSLKTQILKLHNNRDYCAELGKEGRLKALQEYTEERYLLEVNGVINNILKN